jgi:hypothetical protein
MKSEHFIWRGRAARAVGLALGGAALVTLTMAAPAFGQAAVPQSGAKPTAPAGNSPGFWYGTDSATIAITSRAPYREPVIGGAYGGYIGMIGNWAAWQGCHKVVVWSPADANDARTNYVTYHLGIGVGAYWFMAGPGVDPHYNGTTAEATTWGQEQAKATLSDLAKASPKVTYPVVFLDVELPGDAPSYTPAPDNGWNAVYTSPCSGVVKQNGIAAQVDRADFNGFADYLTSHSTYKAGVYSAPSIWADIFGTGSAATITNTYEWTYIDETASLADPPYNWCLAGTRTCAQFFGSITSSSKYALMWQWSGGGGVRNAYGDFDQIDKLRMP